MPKGNYRALITDLDGTAVPIGSDGSDVTRSTTAAVAAAVARGKLIACATGREWYITGPVVKALGIVAPCIIEGGTRIIDPVTEETIWQKALEPQAAEEIFEHFQTHVMSPTAEFIQSSVNEDVPFAQAKLSVGELRFLYLLAITEAEAKAVASVVTASGHGAAHYTPSWSGKGLVDLHVTHPEATKQHALELWHEIMGVTREETIAMGDSGNDMPLFNAAGLRVAVANGTPAIKAVADYIAPAVSDGALEHVIKKLMSE